MKKRENHKNSNGWSMVGICSQWAIDSDMTIQEIYVYMTIVRNSFGYKHRWCYIGYKDFKIKNSKTLKSVIDSLIEKKIILKSWTFKNNGQRALNEYRVVQPKAYIDNFVFDKDNKKENIIIEEDWDK